MFSFASDKPVTWMLSSKSASYSLVRSSAEGGFAAAAQSCGSASELSSALLELALSD